MTQRRGEPRGAPARLGEFASRVLDVAEAIPPGRVMTYGDIAEFIGDGGPRQVGRVMALWGGGVAWWRVVHADGSLLAGHEPEALAHYRAEQTPLRGGGSPVGSAAGPVGSAGSPVRIDMRRARWQPAGVTAGPGGRAAARPAD